MPGPPGAAPGRRRNGASRGDRLDYATLEHAGKPHKGKITDTEKQLVREHLTEINERLTRQGLRTISLTDPDHVERYGLDQLARERTLELEFEDEADAGVEAGAGAEVEAENELDAELAGEARLQSDYEAEAMVG